MDINYHFEGAQELADALNEKSETDFKEVALHNLIQMRDRSVSSRNARQGGTPVGQYAGGGQLRISAGVDANRLLFGYTKDYAPHVEHGHRQTIGRYVPAINARLVKSFVYGQYFLKNNVAKQEPIYIRELKERMGR